MDVSVRSTMISQFCVMPTSKRWLLKIIQVTMKHDPIRCHVGIHADSTTILHWHTPLVPQGVVWSELGPAPPFSPMGVLEVWWSRALSLMCEVALNTIIGVVLMRKNFFLKLGGHGGSSKCYFLFMCMLRRTMIDYEFNLVSDSNSNSIRASPPGWVFGRGTVLLNSRCRCRHFWTSTSLRYG